MTLPWIARLIIFIHIGWIVLVLLTILSFFDPYREDWYDLAEWCWQVEYARD